ncbi:MAG: hypothetical protein A4E71_02119 [Smithella sp. PtaU1.Bin162]|nr:MAG: hypothetical protein A4E71_02119 [Smithella sp. PtaU1.Bin162]
MKRIILLLVVSLCCLWAGIAPAQNKNNPAEENEILTATENLFQFMQSRDYASIWSGISLKTRGIIIKDVQKAEKKATGAEIDKQKLESDFQIGGPFAKSYWDSYLSVFNPDIVLQQCKWEMGKIEKSEAEVILQYKKSEKPSVIKVYRENNAWRVGLEESFGSRRLNPF